MSKKKQQKKIESEQKEMFGLSTKHQTWLFLGLLLVLITILNKPTALDGLAPQGTDVVAGIGKTNQINKFRAETGETPFWNPSIFAGMPKYNDLGPKAFSVDTFLTWFHSSMGNVYIYYLFAALGMFFFLRYLKMSPLVAFIGALMFVLLPHYKGLWMEGHFRKFRALMYLPWILYSFKYFVDKKTILSAALFALAFGIQVRTGHYQIIFYTAVMVFAVGVYPIVKLLIDGKTVEFGKTLGLLFLALALSLGMSAQPLLLNKEYLPYSKRGKTTINLKNKNIAKTTSKSDGVSMEYATNWSTHPLELMRMILPHAYGGIHGEKYTGKEYPQLKNQKLPLYWGFMPFHTMIDYIGVLTILLAFLALFVLRKNNFVFSLGLFALFLIVLSFGKHFESFYALFYNYFPFFNKFRAPTMSITVTSFVFVILAAYGLKYIQNIKSVTKNITNHKNIFYVAGGFLFVGFLIFIVSSGFEYMKPTENYNPQVKGMIKSIRQTLFTTDIYRYVFFVIVFGGMLFGYLSKIINFTQFGIILVIIVVVDLITVQGYYGEDYSKKENLNTSAFQKNKIDIYLEQDKSLHRILPVGKLMGDNRWGYNSQTIGGYSAIKMYTIEELVQNCYYGGTDKKFPINLNVLKFLNVKYLVLDQQFPPQQLQKFGLTNVSSDQNAKLFLYENKNFNKRAFFVGESEVIKDEYVRLEKINSSEFDANKTALLEEELSEIISTPDSSLVKVDDYNLNKLSLNVFTDKTSLLVISELYYPPGWKIYIDGNEVEKIYKTDHAVQSIVVPKGNHKVEVVCHPDSYFFYKNVSWASVGIIYLIIALGIFFSFRKRKRVVS
ncbi:MAG: hypothetical protein V3V16_07845 [Melioribacteraceae bacterium]